MYSIKEGFVSEVAGNGWEVNRQKRNYCFTANCDHLRDIFTSPYIDKVVWDTSVCTGITSPDAFQTLLDDTFGDHLVTNNTASATFNTSGGVFHLEQAVPPAIMIPSSLSKI